MGPSVDRTPTPSEAVGAVFTAVDRLDPGLRAFQTLYREEAVEAGDVATREIAAGRRIGPFHGVPFALKDIVDVEGRVTTAGSACWSERRSPATATIATRLLRAGGVLIGKTKTVEYAYGGWGTNRLLGTPRNPWDAETVRVPGGSSSGSGVAVAAGMVPCAVGTDTGGSVRIPAAYCGLVGLKTTEGLLPTDGIVPLSHTLDTPGPLARTVIDTALMFDVMTGRDPAAIDRDHRHRTGLYTPPGDRLEGVRLGALPDDELELATPEVIGAYRHTLDRLGDLGADIVTFRVPGRFEELRDLTFTIVTPEAWFHHGERLGDPSAPVDPNVRARGAGGRTVTAADYVAAVLERRRLRTELLASVAEAGVDLLITPTNPDGAPPLAEVDEAATPALFTRAANLLALSALSVPVASSLWASGGRLPIAVQFMGLGNDEADLLAVAGVFEQARGPLPRPPLS